MSVVTWQRAHAQAFRVPAVGARRRGLSLALKGATHVTLDVPSKSSINMYNLILRALMRTQLGGHAAVVKKSVNPIDTHVGSRVRMRRLMLDMSQEKLADALGLTFQQVQKYEKGTNRIGASRLQQISNILKVPVAFFFDDAPQPGKQLDQSKTAITRLLATPDGLALVTAFSKIKNTKVRRSVVQLVEHVADDQD
jgi:transcriptional regulator with XRE-family HTH domain